MLTLLLLSQLNPQSAAAHAVIERTIGSRAAAFEVTVEIGATARDSYQLSARNGVVRIAATTGVAACRGFYDYLKHKCNSMVSWEGSNIKLPKVFPDADMSGSTPAEFRHYYNICTFGYTTAFWDWKRWRREIDWMALHGINMPLAMTGQDKVWQTVFRSYNIPDKSIMAFFSGPAFQPWHWMGNINGHGGPPPQSWIDGQARLQKQILEGERALGMKPVVPGFSGFVPVDFDKYVPGVKLDSPTAWAGFQPTKFIDVRDPKFVEVGRKFVEEYRKEFGTDHLYLCDTFNEQNPQFPATTKLADLKRAGQAVYEGLRQGDPDAVWIMQGWLFFNERDYWGKPEVDALLSGVPDDRMIILDLAAEQYPVYKTLPAVAKKGFIYCTLHNFGQNTGLGGDLDHFYQAQAGAQKTEGRMLGFGLTPEGIDQNPIVYEQLTDAMWLTNNPTAGANSTQDNNWRTLTKNYVSARYGYPSAGLLNSAWSDITDALYSKSSPWYKDGWRQRPGRVKRGRPLAQMVKLEAALEKLISEQPYTNELSKNPLFQRDIVDVCKTWLGGIADRECAIAVSAGPEMRTKFFDTLNDIDRLLACRTEHRLSTWISQAREWGKASREKNLLEMNARLQVTAWDYNGVLTDYANKEWAGLTNDFVAARWKMYFAAIEEAAAHRDLVKPRFPTPAEYLAMEVAWAKSTKSILESKAGDALSVTRELFAKYRGKAAELDSQMGILEPPGNIAKAGKAADDGRSEGSSTPDLAIDGDLDTYWAASPSPCTWQLDLGSVQLIRRIVLFPYWGDGRFYQYIVETSTDNVVWETAVDASGNTEESSDHGYEHSLPKSASARYVRIRMLKNSANIGVHLCEVRIYKD